MEKVNWYFYKFCNRGGWKILKSYHAGYWEASQIVLIITKIFQFDCSSAYQPEAAMHYGPIWRVLLAQEKLVTQ